MSTFPVASAVNQSIAERFDDGPESESANVDDEENLDPTTMTELIAGRAASLDHLVSRSRWTLEAQPEISSSGVNVQLVKYPMASRIPYEVLHPALYNFLEPLCGLDQVAQCLGVEGWREEADRIWPLCGNYFRKFVELSDDASQDTIKIELSNVVNDISSRLKRDLRNDPRFCTIVRGTLARDEYEVRGYSDLVYRSEQRFILAAVVETAETFSGRHLWSRRSRGVKLFNALYSYNCPTLLVTQRIFKLFVENSARDGVYTFPSEATDADASANDKFWASTSWHATGDVLFDVLVICLMRAAPVPKPVATRTRVPRVVVSMSPVFNPRLAGISPPRPAVWKRKPAQGSSLPNPRFYTGEDDASGNPIYRTVHVTPFDQIRYFRRNGTYEHSSDDEDICAAVDGV